MKQYVLYYILIAAFGISSCDNELNLVADWKEVPVIYGFISPTDTAQYFRIEKAFLDKDLPPANIAQIPDSLYFENITVELEQVASGQRFSLVRVDGNLEGYPRKPGFFSSAPNYLYKIKTKDLNPEPDKIYRLIVSDEAGRVITTAETAVVGTYEMQFSVPVNPIFFRYDNAIRFGWKSPERTAYFYDFTLLINIQETLNNDPSTTTTKVLEWQVERNLLRGVSQSTVSALVPGIEFYKFIARELDANAQITRKFQTIDVVVDAGAKNLYEYLSVGQANAGITGAEFVASYTNVENGLGLLSSRSRLEANNFLINSTTLDSLRNGIYTKDLNFL